MFSPTFSNTTIMLLYAPESAKVHPKQAIQLRNRWIVDKSDLVVFWVENNSGGAYKTMRYADKCGKETINLPDTVQKTGQ